MLYNLNRIQRTLKLLKTGNFGKAFHTHPERNLRGLSRLTVLLNVTCHALYSSVAVVEDWVETLDDVRESCERFSDGFSCEDGGVVLDWLRHWKGIMAWIGQRNNILGEGCGWVHVRHAPHNDFYRVEVTSGSDIGGTPKKWELATWRSLEGMLENRVSVRKRVFQQIFYPGRSVFPSLYNIS